MDEKIVRFVAAQLLAFPSPLKEVSELTEAERIALCIASGCEMDYRTENINGAYRMVVTTARPVGIQKIEGRFLVCQQGSAREASSK